MMTLPKLLFWTIALAFVFNACANNSENDAALAEQMRQDSVQQAAQAARIKAKADSLAQAMAEAQRLQEEEAIKEEEIQKVVPSSNPDGSIIIQAEAWRSEEFAKKRLDYWKSEGFSSAYVVKIGDEKSGDIWYRIRLMKVSQSDLDQTLSSLKANYNTTFWVID